MHLRFLFSLYPGGALLYCPYYYGCADSFQVGSLIRFIDKTNRELTSFLESIRFSEFTTVVQYRRNGRNL